MWIVKLLKDEEGSSVVIVALMLTVLMSFTALVVDVGLMYAERSRLVSAAEASALAGASNFPYRDDGEYREEDYDYARQAAEKIAEENGLEDYQIRLLPEDAQQKEKIEVTASEEVEFSFARVMGFQEGDVTGQAAAKSVPLAGFTGVVPLGIPEQDFEGYGMYDLKVPAGQGDEGNYQPLRLDEEDSGASVYREKLEEGHDEMLFVGDILETERGNMARQTRDGLEERFEEDEREVVIPIVTDPEDNEVEIVGFGAFYLADIEDGPEGHIIYKGIFQEKVADGELDEDLEDYGLRGTKLVR
ncbi:pilus assembly protein TadG-related protein [Natranaerobius thermophilus]|uniref:Putative Flp pilus-assembly TadG-like N-terminal domain-containing protein n=1 Tax=Natranaerobius thermophilus (strain ATCC BAA-1301 / DSM 18059 / JW/NM-WN-LF) TaxID=457570 RepID=B2A8K0_NATTJ|nr:pilus assembly protein TadG-related protein [Natranaerobius thermophilus]ACB85884.1 conserved hypothetical protein [Natranaerobius thermophilus JW/NM-WN-LF]